MPHEPLVRHAKSRRRRGTSRSLPSLAHLWSQRGPPSHRGYPDSPRGPDEGAERNAHRTPCCRMTYAASLSISRKLEARLLELHPEPRHLVDLPSPSPVGKPLLDHLAGARSSASLAFSACMAAAAYQRQASGSLESATRPRDLRRSTLFQKSLAPGCGVSRISQGNAATV